MNPWRGGEDGSRFHSYWSAHLGTSHHHEMLDPSSDRLPLQQHPPWSGSACWGSTGLRWPHLSCTLPQGHHRLQQSKTKVNIQNHLKMAQNSVKSVVLSYILALTDQIFELKQTEHLSWGSYIEVFSQGGNRNFKRTLGEYQNRSLLHINILFMHTHKTKSEGSGMGLLYNLGKYNQK